MIRGFTFERALGWPFTAAHAATFPWIFGAAYAGVFVLVFGLIGLLAADDFTNWIAMLEAADATNDADAQTALVFSGFARVIPWGLLSWLAAWIIWAMFETASQRRYIWDKPFTLGFGADEARMMIVGLLWTVLALVVVAVPVFVIMGATFYTLFTDPFSLNSPDATRQLGWQILGTFGLLLIILPVYVFLATRLAPSFGLTVREKRIRFFDAWNVSRGRFWPIFGAFVILAVAGNILGQVISGILQALIIPAFMNVADAADSGDLRAALFSPGFMGPVGLYGFVILFLQGLLQHVVGGPAAFAVRHDPRGGIEADAQIGAFD
ncbi:hypothetical protein [Hyphomonas sp.]|uniref:hypothetical protein n=1 Tax=Hyphomonas sp. TaxID=87 RepID=UPI00391D45D9